MRSDLLGTAELEPGSVVRPRALAMRSVFLLLALAAPAGCDAILGIDDHSLAAAAAAPDASNGSGEPAPSLLCSGDSGACVVGAIESVGRVPDADGGGAGVLPDGAVVTLTDDGFELGGAACDSTGTDCVTGAISP